MTAWKPSGRHVDVCDGGVSAFSWSRVLGVPRILYAILYLRGLGFLPTDNPRIPDSGGMVNSQCEGIPNYLGIVAMFAC